jgi:D-aspartate ligase
MIDVVPRLDRSRRIAGLDSALPAVVMWASRFPLQHGCLGVFRTLGRAGVPVYAVVGDSRAPVATSRYVRGSILWQPDIGETYDQLLERLMAFGRCLGHRSLIVCTSDEMAVLVARHRARLQEWFVLPEVAPELPAQLADKYSLGELCRRFDTPSPSSMAIDTAKHLDELGFPLIVKSRALRGQVQNVENTILVPTVEALRNIAQKWTEPFGVMVQRYLPDATSEDWFVHGYCDAHAQVKVIFTGCKVRTWPVQGGATAAAYTAANPELVALTEAFCTRAGYCGVFDIDWRKDLRTGEYFMLDFNPRVGAQFRIFEDDAGIDVVRAMHLDLSGREITAGSQINEERFVVEPWDMASLASSSRRPLAGMGGAGRPRVAWLAADDLRPVIRTLSAQLRLSLLVRIRRRSTKSERGRHRVLSRTWHFAVRR